MQDRLKYRVYDTVEQEYIECDVIRLTPSGVAVWVDKTEPAINPKRFIVEFCIGLRDINGKPIFEGDIVCIIEYGEYSFERALRRKDDVEKIMGMKVPFYNEPPFINKNHSQLIVWDNKRATFAMRDRINSTGRPESLFGKKYIVVGNAHENHELLEKKDEKN